jgi:8-oxo-dGTP pyrophosphatase MutT (NUDIX family)
MDNIFTTLWESPQKNRMGEPFLSVKSWDNRYYFSERAGVDSIAFVLYDHRTNKYGLIREFKCPINEFRASAFGGSLDSDEDMLEIVIAECREEAGFVVSFEDIRTLGKVLVSTQSNQQCYLYMVEVDTRKQVEPQPENDMEALATVEWVSQDEVNQLEDWKAITIIVKSYL